MLAPGTSTIWGIGLLVWGGYPVTNGIVVKYS
jgi:hypothetical protein